jgi:hypothetical protein
MENKKKQPSRKEILTEILEDFQSMYQWVIVDPESYAKYANKAESLIELLEVVDCGSVGGFDTNNPSVIVLGDNYCMPKNPTGFKLFDRFLMILNKYDTKLSKVCDHDVSFFFKFFNELDKMSR